MKKEMFITVGTSLYYSATWENEGPAADVQGYDEWLKGDRRTKPEERRRTNQGKTEKEIRRLLNAEPRDIAKWTAILPENLRAGSHDPTDNLRFSAELSSLLMLADSERASVRDLLSAYQAIHIVVDPDDETPGSSFVAGKHLQSYLSEAAGNSRVTTIDLLEVHGLASPQERPLLEGLQELVSKILKHLTIPQLEQVDLLASGGYKIYPVFLSQLVTTRTGLRLLYMHEEAGKLVRVSQSHIAIGQQQESYIEAFGVMD